MECTWSNSAIRSGVIWKAFRNINHGSAVRDVGRAKPKADWHYVRAGRKGLLQRHLVEKTLLIRGMGRSLGDSGPPSRLMPWYGGFTADPSRGGLRIRQRGMPRIVEAVRLGCPSHEPWNGEVD
jgi:hypothetical protein